MTGGIAPSFGDLVQLAVQLVTVITNMGVFSIIAGLMRVPAITFDFPLRARMDVIFRVLKNNIRILRKSWTIRTNRSVLPSVVPLGVPEGDTCDWSIEFHVPPNMN